MVVKNYDFFLHCEGKVHCPNIADITGWPVSFPNFFESQPNATL